MMNEKVLNEIYESYAEGKNFFTIHKVDETRDFLYDFLDDIRGDIGDDKLFELESLISRVNEANERNGFYNGFAAGSNFMKSIGG